MGSKEELRPVQYRGSKWRQTRKWLPLPGLDAAVLIWILFEQCRSEIRQLDGIEEEVIQECFF